VTITGAIVLLAVIWFLTLYVSLPIGMRSQGDAGKVEPGTPASAPSEFRLRRKLWRVTLFAVPAWAAVTLVVAYGGISVSQIDFFSAIEPAWRADRAEP
jgi:predicted secreted protein